MLVVAGIICLAVALLMPALGSSREAARRNGCTCNGMQLGLALHGHHDAKKYLPVLTSTNVTTAMPGSTAATPDTAGYSWIVRILPFMEKVPLYNTISTNSQGFTLPAFADTITPTGQPMSATNPHLSITQLPALSVVSGSAEFGGTAIRQVSRCDVEGGSVSGCAVRNYTATTATHLACLTATTADSTAEPPNGVIVPPLGWKAQDDGRTTPMGIRFKDITDGSSKTLMAAETREPLFSAWYDGTLNYVVAADPNGPAPAKENGANHYWHFDGVGETALNVGPISNNRHSYRYPKNFTNGGGETWDWGPSSEHSGGVVIHLYADGGVRNVTDDIDPTLYLHLVTRSGGEQVVPPGFEW